MTRPLVAMGSRLSERQPGQRESIWSAVVLGVATGLLWAPCAGPILGIIFTAAALKGASFNTTLLLLAYALGAATSLALALLVGGKVFARMKKSLGASERIRQEIGRASCRERVEVFVVDVVQQMTEPNQHPQPESLQPNYEGMK